MKKTYYVDQRAFDKIKGGGDQECIFIYNHLACFEDRYKLTIQIGKANRINPMSFKQKLKAKWNTFIEKFIFRSV